VKLAILVLVNNNVLFRGSTADLLVAARDARAEVRSWSFLIDSDVDAPADAGATSAVWS
jgi:hypothetical protein